VYRGFLALLEILRRARISGMKRAKISGTDRYKGFMMQQKVRVECRQPLMAVLVAVYKMHSSIYQHQKPSRGEFEPHHPIRV
jgi:hypothetical protein